MVSVILMHALEPSTTKKTTNPFNLVTERDSVGADKSLEDTAVKVLNGVTRENTVGDKSKDGLGAVLLEDGSSLTESAASVGHVIDEDGDLVLDVTDKNLLSQKSAFRRLTQPVQACFLTMRPTTLGRGRSL